VTYPRARGSALSCGSCGTARPLSAIFDRFVGAARGRKIKIAIRPSSMLWVWLLLLLLLLLL